MNCACEVDLDLDGSSETLTNEKRKARKLHDCSECGAVIHPGDIYKYYKGVYEGDLFTNKICLDCLSIRTVFFTGGYYFGNILEDFYEFVRESDGQIDESCIAKLTTAARGRLCEIVDEMWLEYWLDNPTQPAVRFELKQKELMAWDRPGWMHYRNREMDKMDEAVR